jgi:hypothetical protein
MCNDPTNAIYDVAREPPVSLSFHDLDAAKTAGLVDYLPNLPNAGHIFVASRAIEETVDIRLACRKISSEAFKTISNVLRPVVADQSDRS